MDLGTAYVQVVPSARGMSGALQSMLGGEADSAGALAGKKIIGKVTGLLAAAGIGTALVAGMSKSLSEGAKLEQSIGGIETLFKKSSDKMIEYADQAYKTAGISANTYMEQATSFSASLLQSTGGDTEKAAEAANQAIIDMSDNANKMGTNIGSIQDAYQGFAKQNYTMLDNLKLGYGGTKTEMERLLADAEKISGQEYDISNLSDVYEAIHVIQGELDITGTTSKEAASTFSGSFASMQAAASNMLGDLMLGRNIEPAMKGLAESSSTFLFGNLIPAVGRIFMSLPAAAAAFIRAGIPAFTSAGSEMIESLKSGAEAYIPQFVNALPELISMGLDVISQNLPGFLAKGSELIQFLANGALQAVPVLLSTAADIVSQLPDFFIKNAPKIATAGGELMAQLAVSLVKNYPKIMAASLKLGMAITTGLVKLVPTMLSVGVKFVASFVKGISGPALSSVKSAAERVKNAVTKPIESAKNVISGIVNKIKGFFPISGGRLFTGLKLPHFSVSGGSFPFGVGGKGSLPHWNVSWYRKAMDNPYLFTRPTLDIRGYGEAGDEMLYGRSRLMSDIREAAGGRPQQITNNYNVTFYGVDSMHEAAEEFLHYVKSERGIA